MALNIDNGRRVLLFERHCWALRDLGNKERLAFFDALLDYGSTGNCDFSAASGIVRTIMPEIVALSETSWHKAKNRIGKTKNKLGTNEEQTAHKEEEEEKDTKVSSSAHTRAKTKIPSWEEVFTQAAAWVDDVAGWADGEFESTLRECYDQLASAGWTDGTGRKVGKWQTYLRKCVSEKKISRARARVGRIECFNGNLVDDL